MCGTIVFVLLFTILLLALLSGGMILWHAFRVEPFRPQVSTHCIGVAGWSAGASCRLVQLSDLHMWRWGRLYETVLVQVAEAGPHAILLTGDYAESEEGLVALERLLGRLRELAPVYAVLGDNDQEEPAWERRLQELFEASGVTLLRNDARLVQLNGRELLIAGVDDPNTGRTRMDQLNTRVSRLCPKGKGTDEKCAVILAHSPEFVHWSSSWMNLILSGHTHGGQICLPGGKALYTNTPACKGFASGMYTLSESTKMYVHRGVGTARIHARLFCPPEVAVFELVGADTDRARQ